MPVIKLPPVFTAIDMTMPSLDGTGSMVAIDINNGDIIWETECDDIIVLSSTIINDLVLTSVFGGTAFALDRESGEEIWSFQADARINVPMAVAGDIIIIPAGMLLTGQGGTKLIALRVHQ